MPGAVIQPQKRVLGDSTRAHRNASNLPSPSASKRRKLDAASTPGKLNVSQKDAPVKFGSSQPKSQFEEEVLEKLTQDISGLKHKNSEKDQQWDRPGLGDFNERTDSLCFQQIEVEEGTLNGGRTTIKLFGVTEASSYLNERGSVLTSLSDWPFCSSARHRFPPLPLYCCSCFLSKNRLRGLQIIPRDTTRDAPLRHSFCANGASRKSLWVPRESEKPLS